MTLRDEARGVGNATPLVTARYAFAQELAAPRGPGHVGFHVPLKPSEPDLEP